MSDSVSNSEQSDCDRAALQLVVQANDLQHEANRLVSQGRWREAAGYCRRVAVKLELADARRESDSLPVGDIQGWSVQGYPGAWHWLAFVGGNAEEGDCTHRSDAEERAKRWHRRLFNEAGDRRFGW